MCHSSTIYIEQHRKLLPFIIFKNDKANEISFDCEIIISFDINVPKDTYGYGIVSVDKHLASHELVQIMNETLNVKEQFHIMKESKNFHNNKVNSLTQNDDHIDSMSKNNSHLSSKNCNISNVDSTKIKKNKKL